jgi:glycosyltransferase 2 family protein
MVQNSSDQQVSIKQRLFRFNTLIGFIIAAGIIYVFFTRFNFHDVLDIIGRANYLLLIIGIMASYGSLPLRGYRWKELLKESGITLPTLELTRMYFLAWFVNSILPARIGDIYRAYILKKHRQVAFSLSLGVIFSEKVFDLAATALLLTAGGIFYINHITAQDVKSALTKSLIAVVIIVILFIILSWKSGWLQKILPQKLQRYYEPFKQGIFRSPRKIPAISLESLIIWFSEAARLYFVAWALGFKIDLLMAIFISQAALIIMALPLTPAGLGLVELLMFAVLIPAGYSRDAAAAIVIADRLISYWLLIITGGIHYIWSPRYR